MEVLYKTKHRATLRSCNPTSCHISREKHDPKHTYTPVFIAALSTITKTWKQPKCPSTEEWIQKMWLYTKEYYSAIKKDEVMPFATTWVYLESVTLSEENQAEKEKYNIPYMWNLKRNDTNELPKQKQTHRLLKGAYGSQGGVVKNWTKGSSVLDIYKMHPCYI